jgi:hypothetical protein
MGDDQLAIAQFDVRQETFVAPQNAAIREGRQVQRGASP